MPRSSATAGPRERLLEVASRLFFEQGYLATGVNQLIEESGVAKASFYQHFASKEDLGVEYLSVSHQRLIGLLEQQIAKHTDPRDRVLAVFDFLEVWKEQSGFRGCVFLNIVAEIPSTESPLRASASHHYDVLRATVRKLVLAHASAYRPDMSIDQMNELSEMLVLLVEGAMVSSQNYAASWPIAVGRSAAVRLLDAE